MGYSYIVEEGVQCFVCPDCPASLQQRLFASLASLKLHALHMHTPLPSIQFRCTDKEGRTESITVHPTPAMTGGPLTYFCPHDQCTHDEGFQGTNLHGFKVRRAIIIPPIALSHQHS